MTDPAPLPPLRVRPHPEATTARIRNRRLRWVAAALAVALVATATWAAFFSGGPGKSPTERWTTVTATRGAVTQRITSTGTVSHVNESSVRFPTAGRVTEVRVAVGDPVSAGDVLAVLDDSALRLKHVQAQAQVDAALLAVRQASDAPASGPAALPGAPAPAVLPAPQPGIDLGPVAGAVGQANAETTSLASLQQAAREATAEVQRVCPAPGPTPSVPSVPAVSPSSTPTSGASGAPSSSPSTPSSVPSSSASMTPSGGASAPSAQPSHAASTSPSAPAVDLATCRRALASAATAQTALAVAQERASASNLGALGALQGAAQAVAGAVAQFTAWAAALAEAASGGALQSGDAASATQDSASDSTRTAARIQLTKARRALDEARQDLDRATLRAPMTGVVAALPFTAGSGTTPSQAAVVSAPGAVLVTLTVPTASYPFVAPHQRATLRGSGGARAEATVTSKELIPQATGGYAVTLLSSAAGSEAFPAGTSVSVEIEVGAVGDAVVVPLTALNRSGDHATVRVLAGTEVADVAVTLGRIGDTRAEVLDGVHAGDRLVVADASKPIPGFGLGG